MMLEGKESGKGDIAEIMALASMMQGNGATNPFANIMSNPMAMLMLTKNDGGSSKDFMLMMMMQNGGFMKPAAKPCKVAKPCDKCEADKCEDGTAPVNE